MQENVKREKLSQEQVDDLIYILGQDHHKDYRHKLKNVALTILAQSKI